MGFLSVYLLAIIVLILGIGIWCQYQRNQNLKAGWEHRKRIAEIVHEIESDPSASPKAREFVGALASVVFNEPALNNIYLKCRSLPQSKRAEQRREKHVILGDLQDIFGKQNGQKAYEALIAFSYLACLSNLRGGYYLRAKARAKDCNSTKKGEKSQMPAMLKAVIRSVDEFLKENDDQEHVHA